MTPLMMPVTLLVRFSEPVPTVLTPVVPAFVVGVTLSAAKMVNGFVIYNSFILIYLYFTTF